MSSPKAAGSGSAWPRQGCDSDAGPNVPLLLALCNCLFCLIQCFLGGRISLLPHYISSPLGGEDEVVLLPCKLNKLKMFATSGKCTSPRDCLLSGSKGSGWERERDSHLAGVSERTSLRRTRDECEFHGEMGVQAEGTEGGN